MEENKRFTNLAANYRLFLDSLKPIWEHNQLSNSMSYKKLEKIHKNISAIADSQGIRNSDINRLLLYCDNDHEALRWLKDFAVLRNVKLLEFVIHDPKYNDFLATLSENMPKIGAAPIKKSRLEKALTVLWNKYLSYWDGYWHSIEIVNGKLKKIEIVDPSEYQKLLDILNGHQ